MAEIGGAIYDISIDDSAYSGEIFTIQGRAILERPKVKTMDMLRGSVLKMQLETSSTDTWTQYLVDTVGDKQLPVTVTKDGATFWNGFIKPDGIVESFVTDYWIVNIQAIDGLGLLENIKFLNDDGEVYQGSMSELEILTRCLELTGISMEFRIYYMSLFYTVDDTDPVIANQALETTYVNVDRYVKDDQERSVFTAKEVLESILKKYGAFITQQDNQWHIVRIIDYYTNDTSQRYALYSNAGVFINDYSAIMNQELGSDIDGYDPCHANANQQKTYRAALGAYKVFYEYGIVNSILENPKVYFNDGVGDIDGWIVDGSLSDFTFTLRDAIPGYPSGYYDAALEAQTTSMNALSYDYLTYDNDVEESDTVKVEIKLDVGYNINPGLTATLRQYCVITLIGDSGTTYYLNESGEWTLSAASLMIYKYLWKYGGIRLGNYATTFTVESNGVPEDGTITMLFYFPITSGGTDYGSYTIIKSININQTETGIKGESYTARKLTNVSAVVDTEDKVYVGDNESDVYIGAIEDSSADNTLRWSKEIARTGIIDTTKQFPLLNWLARDRMQISSGNQLTFRGGILGYLPYLGVHEINNINGVFMCVSHSHDLREGRIEAEFERIFLDDIYSSVEVEFNLESENIVKPSIE